MEGGNRFHWSKGKVLLVVASSATTTTTTTTIASLIVVVVMMTIAIIVMVTRGLGGLAHVHSRGRGVRSLGYGVVHTYPASIQLQPIAVLLGIDGVFNIFKVDKRKPPRTSRLMVIHDLHLRDGAVL